MKQYRKDSVRILSFFTELIGNFINSVGNIRYPTAIFTLESIKKKCCKCTNRGSDNEGRTVTHIKGVNTISATAWHPHPTPVFDLHRFMQDLHSDNNQV